MRSIGKAADRHAELLTAATKKVCLFLGAGFSKWSCDLPLVGGLFDFAVRTDNDIEKRRLQKLEAVFSQWSSGHSAAHAEQFIAYAQERQRTRQLVNWYVVRRLTDDFVSFGGTRRTFYINSFRATEHKGVAQARRLIERMFGTGLLSIITTNYDMVPEYALGSRRMNYGVVGEQIGWTRYPYIQPVLALGDIRIAKLHGSVSWNESGLKTTDSRFGLTGKCLIVPPISEKVPSAALMAQWELGRAILSDTDVLVVFGFSFNDNDLAVRRLVGENLKAKAAVVFVDAVDHRPRLPFVVEGRETAFLSVLDHAPDALIGRLFAAVNAARVP